MAQVAEDKVYDILTPNTRTGAELVVEDSPRAVRTVFAGETIAASDQMKLVHQKARIPVYHFPLEAVRRDLATPGDAVAPDRLRGALRPWHIRVGDRTAENAMTTYEGPVAEAAGLVGLAAIRWDAMDHWYEEAEEVFVHARDPYKRIDVIASTRHVQVRIGGETVADSRRPHLLFETGLPTRYYLPRDDVRMDLLAATELTTACPYKGRASYYTISIGGKEHENAVWWYPDPIPECHKIRDLLCFYNENVEAIVVDGVEVPKPVTHWSL